MFCCQCGVKLADSEEKCPLCGLPVYHPVLTRKPVPGLYPPYHPVTRENFSRSGWLFLLTVVCVIPQIICLLCDIKLNGALVWSGYVIGGLCLSYIIVVLPLWFKKANPVIFTPADFIGVGLFLLYINLQTGGNWFLTLAFPIVGYIGLLCTAVVTLAKYLKKGYLYVAGGALIATGGLAVLVEFFVYLTFGVHAKFPWSVYPLVTCTMLGLALIVIAICKPLRQSLHKKFFL